jgi:hypothetical protein
VFGSGRGRFALEATAAGLEQLHKNGCLITQVQITIHEPGKRYTVHPDQLGSWLRTYDQDDNVGLRALKARVREILSHNPTTMDRANRGHKERS